MPPKTKPVKQTQVKQNSAQTSKSAKRRLRRKDKPSTNVQMAPVMNYASSAPTRKPMFNIRPSGISQDGMNFLKCAFAPPDFNGEKVSGVPDSYTNRSLVKKHKLVTNVTYAANVDTYIVVLPTPGVAYWTATVAAGTPFLSTTLLNPVYYSDTTSLFGPTSGATTDQNVTDFRYVSQAFELINTANEMTWSGNIQAFKFKCSLTLAEYSSSGLAVLAPVVTGLQSLNSAIANQYTAPYKAGVFMTAGNANGPFNFSKIVAGYSAVPPIGFGLDDWFGTLNGMVTGFGELESLCIKVSGVTATESAILKSWACVEYMPNTVSPLYEYCSFSPREDQLALQCYREIMAAMPVAVPYFENDGLWQRVLRIIQRFSGALAYIPGPYGAVAGGVNMTANALAELSL
jgi:hypothetical protein